MASKAAPLTLRELIELKLPAYRNAKRTRLYRSTLRADVRRMDTSRPPRSFADKNEWKEVLKQLQEAGALTYMVANDEIHLPEPEVVSDLDDSD